MSRFRSQSDWKKYLPIALVAALLFGAYQLYDARAKRAFKKGFGHGISAMVSNVPYFGARYNKSKVSQGRRHKYRKATASRYSKKKYRKGRKYRKGLKAVRRRSRRRR